MSCRKPNIVFFFSDQQRWDTAGCLGGPAQVTPNLDAMAKEGVCFTNAFTCQPVCGPARACLQTGKYATQTGCYRNNIALPMKEKTLASYLKEAGYKAGYVGKWHLASTGDASNEPLEDPVEYIFEGVPRERRGGYDDFWIASDVLEATSHGYGGYLFDEKNKKTEFTGYRTDAVTDYALGYIKSWRKDEPHFLFLSHIEPHHQNDRNCFEGPAGSKERFKDFAAPADLKDAPGDWGSDWKTQYPDYLGCCRRLDDNLGRVLECLKENGLRDNTIVIYTSDHGSHFKTRTMEYKRSCHDASIHIPLVISAGKDVLSSFTGGRKEERLVSLIDLPPTILRMAGIRPPEDMAGHAVQDMEKGQWQQDVFLQISESQVGRCIRTEKYKYSVRSVEKNGWLDAGADVYYEDYFYDLAKDPHELHNLSGHAGYEQAAEELKKRLKEYIRQVEGKEAVILPPLPWESVHNGLNARVCDLVEHPLTKRMMKELLPADFTERVVYQQTKDMRISEALKIWGNRAGEDIEERLLSGLCRYS
ncbi:sulfatase-like hydrolase/transferase [Murimonas intestini]|uniref:sulfatase-like hydrolase/transferase n=1 Tax=Murimonas intestini TaxID=1337051 RepID=UPI00248CA97F|nr:sulfatase-like hydrolase/transferase [Murimonas intestini]